MTQIWKSLEKIPAIKVGDLVRKISGIEPYGADLGDVGVVVGVGVNMWGEEMIPTGVEVLWSNEDEVEVEYEDEVELIK